MFLLGGVRDRGLSCITTNKNKTDYNCQNFENLQSQQLNRLVPCITIHVRSFVRNHKASLSKSIIIWQTNPDETFMKTLTTCEYHPRTINNTHGTNLNHHDRKTSTCQILLMMDIFLVPQNNQNIITTYEECLINIQLHLKYHP